MTARELIQRVLELDKKATKGPWETSAGDSELLTAYEVETPHDGYMQAKIQTEYPGNKNNCALIADYRTSAPLLARMLLKAIEGLNSAESALLYFETMQTLGSDADFAAIKRKKITGALAELDSLAAGEKGE